jgi:hypothetical protein
MYEGIVFVDRKTGNRPKIMGIGLNDVVEAPENH